MRKDKVLDPRNHAVVAQALYEHKPNPRMRLMPLFGSANDARHAGYT
jgi:hypothetical protein